MIDRYPRTFQADIYRLYAMVIQPALDALPVVETHSVEGGTSFEDRLDRLAGHVTSHTAVEARKAFVLMLAAAFERQLRGWAAVRYVECGGKPIPTASFAAIIRHVAKVETRDPEAEEQTKALLELHLAANVVRHGEGDASVRLRAAKPELWVIAENASRPGGGREPDLRIPDTEIHRFVAAIIRFWGNLDLQPGAVLAAP